MLDEDLEIIDLTTNVGTGSNTSTPFEINAAEEGQARLRRARCALSHTAALAPCQCTPRSCTLRAGHIDSKAVKKNRGYQRVQIPVGATTSNSSPTCRCTKTNRPQMPGRARTGLQRRRRDFPNDCRDSCTSYPRARRSAHRCARRRVSTAPVTERLHWQTDHNRDSDTRLFA